ncbi:hypothetical protein CORC01_13417 [Colletotrichum orchidophilum]|uniref:Suppressor protein SRP40 n=1 Tax=Colletotrichum orchidophilum TaxID=1209926 RepID=A0A1G4AQK8_9PEZI|nr:uncharacterized protein CORC01_13417 [Colletotrichum orchidophilum]OHE91302.1 hypothetical protein CORC01_13417 [Colletotrichum orchidophilum]
MPPSAAPTASDPAGPSDTSSAYTRLHITPFDQDLLKVVIPSAILRSARNISFHTIETFPDKRFGFVDVPEADAEKIKKRLNGAVLKGSKMRIDKARPAEDYMPVAESEETGKKRKKSSKEKEERKRQKRDENVLEGVELRDRKVKRGWTVPEEAKIREKKSKKEKGEKKEKKDKTKKREERSKYTDREECLLKTKLPAKQLPAAADPEDEPDRKKRRKKAKEVVIHEFEKTTKFPTFLKAAKPAPTENLTTEFVEGKGWVDTQGNLIESAKTRRTATAPAPESKSSKPLKKAKAPTPPPPVDDDTTSSSGTSSDEDTSSDESSDEEAEQVNVTEKVKATESVKAAPVTPAKQTPKAQAADDDDTSSSDSSSSDDDSSDSDEERAETTKVSVPAIVDSPLSAIKAADATRPRSAASNVSLTIKIPPSTPAQVHPLEALYKRPKQDGNAAAGPAKEAEPFSFFGSGGDDIEEDEDVAASSQMPMTPFTAQDVEWRNVRSAAPTPDTAHPNHTKPFWAIGNEGEEEEDEDEETREEIEATLNAERNADPEGSSGPGGDFQKWFWENRRDLNQSWMKRRKSAAKERRHRDNKSRASKAV